MKKFSFGAGRAVGFDLGSYESLVSVRNGETTLREPSVVAIDAKTKRVLAAGNEADEMLGRTPENINAIRPVRGGVIAELQPCAAMIKTFLKKSDARSAVIKPRVGVAVPSGITEVERRAVLEAFTAAGAGSVTLIEEAVCAALGAGVDVCAPRGTMVVCIGAGTVEAAVMSLGGIVCERSVRVAGNAMNEAIASYIKREYSITVGEKTAEKIKHEIGSAQSYADEDGFDVKGRETATGLPKNVRITAAQVRGAMADAVSCIVNAVLDTLEETPPELAGDILSDGIVLVGGGAYIRGIDKVIEEATGISVRIAGAPAECVCQGARIALTTPAILRRSALVAAR